MAFIISADDIKITLAGYQPKAAEKFHVASAKQADHIYVEAIKTRVEPTVILMSGGSASGKSEYVSAYLKNESAIVFDGTLPTLLGATIKIQRAKKANKVIEIHAVLPKSLVVAFAAFLNRDRKFPAEHFFRTHCGARRTLLEITHALPTVMIKIVVSDVDFVSAGATMTFRALSFRNRLDLIEFLERSQYTEEAMKALVFQS